jgi:hypothetical protein
MSDRSAALRGPPYILPVLLVWEPVGATARAANVTVPVLLLWMLLPVLMW